MEFAIILPLLLTIVWGSVDFGRFFHTRYSVINAAREGAAHASVTSSTSNSTAWQAEVRQVVLDEMSQLYHFDPTLAAVTITRDFTDGPVPRLRVAVQYPFATVVGWPVLPNSFQIAHTAEMRAIR